MKVDEIQRKVKLPVCIIGRLATNYKGKSDELVDCLLVNYDCDEYYSVAVKVDNYENEASQYGYYYIKRDVLDKYLNTGEFKMENKEYKYYYRVEYVERDLVKIIPSNKKYISGDYIVFTSNSHKYCIGFINEVMLSKEEAESKYSNKQILDRRIICKIEDDYGKKLRELDATRLNIKALNKLVSEKYLLLLLNNETNEDLEKIKSDLKALLEKEKTLVKELEQYE